ncbi:ROK family transcriptional regulator [Alkalicoccus halolimnae]|uniref:ROK family transcriptional regulator n=1 Tax=Alkalicoccus halolimnae TaxID=1667239 RepID=A0A5C7FH66_9BACI|nr:ROK family transcriptional regulator [Alkalicoccus halolimnae]TXF85479.1 ROK family transcriptional regulator [Alkalicoccus halolimnae]
MFKGDASYIKNMNRKIILETLIQEKQASRSELARKTGLNKATISVQIQDLLDEQLIIERAQETATSVGRKPIILELNHSAGFTIGLDIDENFLSIILMNLQGDFLYEAGEILSGNKPAEVMNEVAGIIEPIIKNFADKYKPLGLLGIGIGIHGIVNNEGMIVFTPKQQWSNISCEQFFQSKFQCPVYVNNNANFSVFAEQLYDGNTSDLFCLSISSGIGLGIMKDKQIYRGYGGFAGEIGHMIIESNGLKCPCGNNGCLELYASEKAILKKLDNLFPNASEEEKIKSLLSNENSMLDYFIHYVSIGLNNVINIFNPEKLIINSSILSQDDNLIPELEKKLQSRFNHYKDIRISKLGKKACPIGAAAYALRGSLKVESFHFVNLKALPHKADSK